MSQQATGEGRHTRLGIESGLEALRQSPEFRGPVEPLDGHEHANDHLALIYESREEQFAAAIPFIRQGLELGERCVYITHENSREEVAEAMRAYSIDVDDAVESGALSIFDDEETYLRTGSFAAEDTLAFLDDAIAEATEEYEALRVTGEMSFVLGDEPAVEDLVVCESKANYLFRDVDGMALCQYNRERFPPEVIRDVINTHPHLIHDNRVSHNFYYVPPTEFLDTERPSAEIDRMMGTLREQTEAKVALQENQRFLQESYAVTSDPNLPFEEKLERLLELGCDYFDLDVGSLTHLSAWQGGYRIEKVVGADGGPESIQSIYPEDGYLCRRAIEEDEPLCVADVREIGWDASVLDYQLASYFGTKIIVGTEPYGTVWFGGASPRHGGFTATERTYLDLIGQWVSNELERQRHEQELEETINRLRQSNDRLQQFAYASSHDLQEPLRMVSSYLRLLETRYRDELDEDAREYIDFAVNGADRMRMMVDDLLAFAKVEQSDGEFEPVECDAVLERVTDDLHVQIEENDAEITVTPLPTVIADANQLEQLFCNLVSNAIKYSDSPPEVEISVEERPDCWEFSVADNGIGIDPEKTDRIFEIFKRLHHDDEYPGTGVGLSLCQEIAENHDGDIWVESVPGEGSTFFFTLAKQMTGDSVRIE